MRHAGARVLRDDEEGSRRPTARRLELVEPPAPRPGERRGGPQERSGPGERRGGPGERLGVSGERRTVKITGQPVPPRRRRSTASDQLAARPDRMALWAVLLGLFLVFMAVATANAAPL